MQEGSHGEKPMLVAFFVAGLIVGIYGYGLLYGLVAGLGLAAVSLFIAEFLGALIGKELARYVMIGLACVIIFKVVNDPESATRGGSQVCVDAGRFGQEKCIE